MPSARSPTEFAEAFGRDSGGLVRRYRTDDAEVVVVALGSVLGSLADVVDELRDEGVSVGALGVTCYRPWPVDEVRRALRGVPRVIVLNRAVAVGSGSILGQDVRLSAPRWTTIHDVVLGLGGRPVTRDVLKRLVLDVVARRLGSEALTFYDLDQERAATELARELADAPSRAETDDDHDSAQALPGRHLRRRQPVARSRASGPSSRPPSGRARSPRATARAVVAARRWRPGW